MQLATDLYHNCNNGCKEMGGATFVISVAFSRQTADTTQWFDTSDWTVCCDWLQVASSRKYMHNIMLMRAASLAGIVASFITVVIAFSYNLQLATFKFYRSCEKGLNSS